MPMLPLPSEIMQLLREVAALHGKRISNFRLRRLEKSFSSALERVMGASSEEWPKYMAALEKDVLSSVPTVILLAGGAGFLGSNFARYLLNEYPDYHVTVLDSMTYAANPTSLVDLIENTRFKLIRGDITDCDGVAEAVGDCDVIFNFASETHLDRAVKSDLEFYSATYRGTQYLMTGASVYGIERFIQISTDEVYGHIEEADPDATEEAMPRPRNSYAMAKACADDWVLDKAAEVPVIVARPSNVYGPYQHPEKLVPLLITNAIDNLPLPLYGKGDNVREWLYVDDLCTALDVLLHRGAPGEVHNIGSGRSGRKTNKEVAEYILRGYEKCRSKIIYIDDRANHDFRYAIDSSKIRLLGWEPKTGFEDGITKTLEWYLSHRGWWRPLKDEFVSSEFALFRYGDIFRRS